MDLLSEHSLSDLTAMSSDSNLQVLPQLSKSRWLQHGRCHTLSAGNNDSNCASWWTLADHFSNRKTGIL